MRVVVEFDPDEFDQLGDATKGEVAEWIVDMLNSSVDTQDGGIFLGFDIGEREVTVLIKE